MRTIPGAIGLFALLLLGAGDATGSTATIGFDELSTKTTSYVEHGYRLSIDGGAVFLVGMNAVPDPPAMFASHLGLITLRPERIGAFDLLAIDVREINRHVGPQTVVFAGTRADGSAVTHKLTTDGDCCAGPTRGFQTFRFPPEFRNLGSLSWNGPDIPISKITLDNLLLRAARRPTPDAPPGLPRPIDRPDIEIADPDQPIDADLPGPAIVEQPPHLLPHPWHEFGEPNESAGGAHPLEPGRHRAALRHREDIDYYVVEAPPSPFGSWFTIGFAGVNLPADFEPAVTMLDAGGSILASERGPQLKFWIALESGARALFEVKDEYRSIESPVLYDVYVGSRVIRDALEVHDGMSGAKELRAGVRSTALMCSVLDNDGERVHLEDWYVFQHAHCQEDCVEVSRPAWLEMCDLTEDGGCSGGSSEEPVTEICSRDHFECGDCEFKPKQRYVRVFGERHYTDDFPYGIGDLPDRYRTPYTIVWRRGETATWDSSCPDEKRRRR